MLKLLKILNILTIWIKNKNRKIFFKKNLNRQTPGKAVVIRSYSCGEQL